MSERSIAEIIGWQRCALDEFDDDMGGWRKPDGRQALTSDTPTVDDMLAWLRKRGNNIGVTVHSTLSGPVYVRIENGWVTKFYEAPTLHGALSAAVRAIDERSGE